jgi:fido (protein-threonine AMPylation protein)
MKTAPVVELPTQLPPQAWSSPSTPLAPKWEGALTKEISDRIERFMQLMPTASLDEAKLSGYGQLRFVRSVMHIIGQELNAVEPLSKGGTFEAIFAALSSGAAEPEGMAQAFHVEGGVEGNPQPAEEWKKMVWQCVRALRRLLEEDELTVQGLIDVHEIMMAGAYGTGAAAGEGCTTGLRDEPAFAGRFDFAAPEDILPRCEAMADRFNKKLAEGKTHPVQLATDLMYDLVTVHPFSNGNGRLCRMVFTYALHRCGFPLLVMYSSRHSGKRERKDYLAGIIKAQTSLSVSARYPMYSTVPSTLSAQPSAMANAETYFMGPDSDEWSVEVPSPRSAVV